MNTKDHWEKVYTTRASDAVSWYQATPDTSLRLIDACRATPAT